MIDDQVDEIDNMSGLELWLSDLSTDSATRNLGAVLLGIGGALGIIIGIMLISGNVSDILSGQMEESGGTADIEGIVISELVGNSSGGNGVEGVEVTLFDQEGLVAGSDSTDSGESYLGESVIIATIFAVFALLTGFAGIAGALEANKGTSYRKTWWLAFFSLWSGGMIFVGPLFTLSGMGLVGLSRNQFYDVYSKED